MQGMWDGWRALRMHSGPKVPLLKVLLLITHEIQSIFQIRKWAWVPTEERTCVYIYIYIYTPISSVFTKLPKDFYIHPGWSRGNTKPSQK